MSAALIRPMVTSKVTTGMVLWFDRDKGGSCDASDATTGHITGDLNRLLRAGSYLGK